jgi:glycosyltransferase involved in cell wall biosynthesis
MKGKISVIVPSFNQGKFIERSLLSIIKQTYKNFEIILVDGGSTDETIDIIRRYSNNLVYWVSEIDRGQSHALNKALQRCSGDFVCWLNTDDIFLPHAFEEATDAFFKNPEARVIFADWAEINEKDEIIDTYYAFDYNMNQLIYEGFMMNAQSMFWKRDIDLYFDERLHRTMDYDFMIRLGLKVPAKEIVRVESLWGYFRRHSGQKTLSLDEKVVKELNLIHHQVDKNFRWQALFRLYFRFRRMYWYMKRGGLPHTLRRLFR